MLSTPTDLIELYEKSLPKVFPGREIDTLTARAIRWRTIQNQRSKREIPENCFSKISPRKVLILRDPFLVWLSSEMARADKSNSKRPGSSKTSIKGNSDQ